MKLIAPGANNEKSELPFINTVTGGHLEIGESLQSCTIRVQTAECTIRGEHVKLIDTPGFDDTHRSQSAILKDIADFLEQTYEQNVKLSGIIYMYRISDNRAGGIARENFALDAMSNVVIATTMWSGIAEDVGVRRERELSSETFYFKDATDQGARFRRLYNTPASAEEMMDILVANSPRTLQLQGELVDEHRPLLRTSAGEEASGQLRMQASRQLSGINHLQNEVRAANSDPTTIDRSEQARMQAQITAMQETLERIRGELENLAKEPPRKRPRWMARVISRGRKKLDAIFVRKCREGAGCLSDGGLEL
ncbi:hypothetical protein POSPLADRAFT_1047446 [Postia placenta MAD-698-R-SB12]|uniref:Uncharacterized protein n=1 Tax=Postia placenta MAD-698-R-SB12 TaxID=670580 RepID=A0A1X6MXX2_9APHY|nr:hypothetical protein POSPLADRAFT_1047446 [Postia placenta MAD-698-R-SB12]OSX61199.1 hypothetical protein POSPLADRAFT_1047446 [Postia placenta MAD-698-R-SB12]